MNKLLNWKIYAEYFYRIFLPNISTKYFYRIYLPNISDYFLSLVCNKFFNSKYLKGLTVVNRNHSANPLSIYTVFPIAIKALKKVWGCTLRHMDVELILTYLCRS